MKNTSLDAKREEFRKYLEKEGVLEYLTKHLVPLYEKADKPTSALEYLKNNFARKEVEDAKQKAEPLESENRDLKKNVKRTSTNFIKNLFLAHKASLVRKFSINIGNFSNEMLQTKKFTRPSWRNSMMAKIRFEKSATN